ncbi:hypothetical protein EDD92_0165 [Streptomyces sp. TLI_185]|nr:hypothetical protein EDD92_0165 [Streptomyces sp. TLI_185]
MCVFVMARALKPNFVIPMGNSVKSGWAIT